jgi:hypothetical protein
VARPHPSRRAHARSSSQNFPACAPPQDEDEHRRGVLHHVKQPSSFPRRAFAPGVCISASPTRMRGGRSAERRSGACEAPVLRAMTRHARRLRGALRPMTRDARLSALHRGGFGLPGPRFSPRYRPRLALRPASDRIQRAPRSQVVVPGGRGPCLPRRRLQAAAAGRHAPLRLQDASGDAPQRARMESCSTGAIRSQ